MIDDFEIRESVPSDVASIEALYPDAFPDEDLLPLVRDLLSSEPIVLSLVASVDGAVAGHVIFTECGLTESAGRVSLLGPLAVTPTLHRQGIGAALVRAGFQRLKQDGVIRVFVLGDPAYYGRFGFLSEDRVSPPYPLPEEWDGAWQSASLTTDGQLTRGMLTVPPPWQQPALWAP